MTTPTSPPLAGLVLASSSGPRLLGRDSRRNRLRFEWLEDRTLLARSSSPTPPTAAPARSARRSSIPTPPPARRTRSTSTIPGSGVQTIAPLSALPAITQAGADRRLVAAWLRRHAPDRDRRRPGRRRRTGSMITGIERHRPRPRHQRLHPGRRHSHHRDRAPRATGSTATSWAPIRPARRPCPTTRVSRSTRAPRTTWSGPTATASTTRPSGTCISGNLFAGVWITGQGTSSNAVAGNFIGTDITGSVALNNGTQPVTDSQGNVFGGGVAISAGASGNRIGTDGKSVDDVGERNVIAGSNNDAHRHLRHRDRR